MESGAREELTGVEEEDAGVVVDHRARMEAVFRGIQDLEFFCVQCCRTSLRSSIAPEEGAVRYSDDAYDCSIWSLVCSKDCKARSVREMQYRENCDGPRGRPRPDPRGPRGPTGETPAGAGAEREE